MAREGPRQWGRAPECTGGPQTAWEGYSSLSTLVVRPLGHGLGEGSRTEDNSPVPVAAECTTQNVTCSLQSGVLCVHPCSGNPCLCGTHRKHRQDGQSRVPAAPTRLSHGPLN